MQPHPRNWRWLPGPVNPAEEHIEIRFGRAPDSGWDQWQPVARLAPPQGQTFTVEFLIAPTDYNAPEMIKAVIQELDFYLIAKGETNPWAYARYHCSTAANVYSRVHWSFIPKSP